MSFTDTNDGPVVPLHHAVQQAHRAGVRNQAADFRFADYNPAEVHSSLVPERVKIEPVVRGEMSIMLQPLHIFRDPVANIFSPPVPVQDHFIGQPFEEDVVSITTAIDAEKQNDRTVHQGGKNDRTGWKGGGAAEKIALGGFTVTGWAVAKNADEVTGIKTFLYLQQGIRPIRR